jgi:hypothetical protein
VYAGLETNERLYTETRIGLADRDKTKEPLLGRVSLKDRLKIKLTTDI